MKRLQEIEGEQWLPVPGFPGYSVSNLGRFCRLGPTGQFELEGKIDRIGYQQIGLIQNGKQKWFLAHRIIAATWFHVDSLSALDGTFLTVNHKDRNKRNNKVDNLELVTVAQNHQHWRRHTLESLASVKLVSLSR